MKQAFISFLIFFTAFACGSDKNNDDFQNLRLIKKYNLQIDEPSGLTFSNDRKNLITVSDDNSTIYFMNFRGVVQKKIYSQGYDYEGVTYIDSNTIAVISEEKREIQFLTESGKLLLKKEFKISDGINSGLEGIAFNRKNHHTFLANEFNPRMIIELNDSLNIVYKREFDSVADISGLFYDEKNDFLWFISDESKLVVKCDKNLNLIAKYKIRIEKAEGIAIDYVNKLIYIVSDYEEKLYIYQLPE